MNEQAKPSGNYIAVAWLVILAALVYGISLWNVVVQDDTYISLIYSRNLARGRLRLGTRRRLGLLARNLALSRRLLFTPFALGLRLAALFLFRLQAQVFGMFKVCLNPCPFFFHFLDAFFQIPAVYQCCGFGSA